MFQSILNIGTSMFFIISGGALRGHCRGCVLSWLHASPAHPSLPSRSIPARSWPQYLCPHEFNGLLGLAEACLYALRLYEVVINHASPSEEDRLRLNAGTIAGIQQVREVIGRGWSSDVIMQAVMDWSKLLDESDSIARALLSVQSESESDDEEDEHGKPFDFCRPSGTPTLELVARYFLVSNPSNYEDAEDLVGGPLDEEARTHGLTINPYKASVKYSINTPIPSYNNA